jgi:hypothetical protein
VRAGKRIYRVAGGTALDEGGIGDCLPGALDVEVRCSRPRRAARVDGEVAGPSCLDCHHVEELDTRTAPGHESTVRNRWR